MAGPKTETIKEETMRRTGMTSKAYDKMHRGYELTQPEAYLSVMSGIDKEDARRLQNKENKTTKELDDRMIRSGNRKIKKASGGAVHTMPNGKKMKGAKHGMKHGGAVKKCRMDGIALRGKTRAKERGK